MENSVYCISIKHANCWLRRWRVKAFDLFPWSENIAEIEEKP